MAWRRCSMTRMSGPPLTRSQSGPGMSVRTHADAGFAVTDCTPSSARCLVQQHATRGCNSGIKSGALPTIVPHGEGIGDSLVVMMYERWQDIAHKVAQIRCLGGAGENTTLDDAPEDDVVEVVQAALRRPIVHAQQAAGAQNHAGLLAELPLDAPRPRLSPL